MEKEIKLTEDDGITKFILVEGFGSSPQKGQEVIVDYIGKLSNGEVFDSSISKGKQLMFVHGQGEVIKGWDIGIASMRCGEKAKLIIKSGYAYGAEGYPPKIPPDATLEFEIELIYFHNKSKPIPELTDTEKEQAANEYKRLGNEYFKRDNLRQAYYGYKEGVRVIENTLEHERTEEMKTVWIALHTNLCLLFNKQEKWNETVKAVEEVLSREKDHPKARYLRGIANKNLKNLDEALTDLQIAFKANPNDQKILLEIQSTKHLKSLATVKENQSKKNKSLVKCLTLVRYMMRRRV